MSMRAACTPFAVSIRANAMLLIPLVDLWEIFG